IQTLSFPGYWGAFTSLTVEADQHYDVTLAMVEKCFASISGTLVNEGTGLPAAGIPLVLQGLSLAESTVNATTNAQGEFSFPTVSLGSRNSVATRTIVI